MNPINEGLFRAVLEQPYDDMVRLIYADWFEENGHAVRADVIRVMIHYEAQAHTCSQGPRNPFVQGIPRVCPAERQCPYCTGFDVAQKILYAPAPAGSGEISTGERAGFHWGGRYIAEQNGENNWFRYTRGFVGYFQCRMRKWLEMGDKLVLDAPLVGVRLIQSGYTLEPYVRNFEYRASHHAIGTRTHQFLGWRYHRQAPEVSARYSINSDIWERLPGLPDLDGWKWYGTEQLAHQALSRAALSYAREKAGLPHLPGLGE